MLDYYLYDYPEEKYIFDSQAGASGNGFSRWISVNTDDCTSQIGCELNSILCRVNFSAFSLPDSCNYQSEFSQEGGCVLKYEKIESDCICNAQAACIWNKALRKCAALTTPSTCSEATSVKERYLFNLVNYVNYYRFDNLYP
jgi:hypothetical protein